MKLLADPLHQPKEVLGIFVTGFVRVVTLFLKEEVASRILPALYSTGQYY